MQRIRKRLVLQFLWHISWAVALIAATGLALGGCDRKEPLRLGFIGGLSGKGGGLGTAGRDGVLLAIEECNRQGGIRGQKIELLVKDDGNLAEQANQAERELIDAGVHAIIGPMTSEMASAVYETVQASGLVMIPPTVTSSTFVGRDDHVLRVAGINEVLSIGLAKHCARQQAWKTAAIIFDLANKTYSQTVAEVFEQTFNGEGGRIDQRLSFTSSSEYSLKALAAQALNGQPDGVLVIAAPMEAALLCQQLKKQDNRIALAVSGWALAEEFIQNGGQAVEGAVLSTHYPPDYVHPALTAFQQSFQQRFNRRPSFPSEVAYEAATVILAGLHEETVPRQLKATLLRMQRFPGLRGVLIFDRFGDVQRAPSLVTVKNGAFISLP